jgi:hypothetical protein
MQTVPADPLLKAVTDGADDDDDVGYWAGSDRTVHIYIYIYIYHMYMLLANFSVEALRTGEVCMVQAV